MVRPFFIGVRLMAIPATGVQISSANRNFVNNQANPPHNTLHLSQTDRIGGTMPAQLGVYRSAGVAP